MSARLISRSPDLARLKDEGYELEVSPHGLLLVHHVPYVTSEREVAYGTLGAALTLAGDETAPPGTHMTFFIGGTPCAENGQPLQSIIAGDAHDAAPGIRADHQFSSKPQAGRYADYYEQMTTYVEILAREALALDPKATARTHGPIQDDDPESVFKYMDTASSRAGIGIATEKLRIGRVAVVGLGGTGSYVLDQLAKTPVGELHPYDGDQLLSHNAFRAPGAPSLDDLKERPMKVDYLCAIYSRMRRGIVPHAYAIDAGNVGELQAMDFVFICVDHGPTRELIVRHLTESQKQFIDVGMGVDMRDGSIGGLLRVTTGTATKSDHLERRLPYGDVAEDDYRQNIQIADLNGLNAMLAVIKWKKLMGFYDDLEHEHNCVYEIDGNTLINEDHS